MIPSGSLGIRQAMWAYDASIDKTNSDPSREIGL